MPTPGTANIDFQWREHHEGTYHKTSVVFLGCVGVLKSAGELFLTQDKTFCQERTEGNCVCGGGLGFSRPR